MFYKELGDNIKKARDLIGLTQEDFGRLVGVSESCVSYWETNKRKMHVHHLAVLHYIGIYVDIPKVKLTEDAKKFIENIKYIKYKCS
jgi:transcriptional regulator with XRE-family HTH domain